MEPEESLWLLNRAGRIIIRGAERLFLGSRKPESFTGSSSPLGHLPGLMGAVCKVAWGAVLWGHLQRCTNPGTTVVCFGLSVGVTMTQACYQ